MNLDEKFIQLIQEQQAVLYKIASLYTKTREDREDLVQEIVYQLWKSFASFEGRAKVGTWLYRVAMNVAIQSLRKQQRSIRPVGLPAQLNMVAEKSNTREAEQWQQLQSAIEQLSLLERGILMLHLERKSYQEMAEIVGISASNIGTRLNRIKAKLKKTVHQKTHKDVS